jgi:hypothetical protein
MKRNTLQTVSKRTGLSYSSANSTPVPSISNTTDPRDFYYQRTRSIFSVTVKQTSILLACHRKNHLKNSNQLSRLEETVNCGASIEMCFATESKSADKTPLRASPRAFLRHRSASPGKGNHNQVACDFSHADSYENFERIEGCLFSF